MNYWLFANSSKKPKIITQKIWTWILGAIGCSNGTIFTNTWKVLKKRLNQGSPDLNPPENMWTVLKKQQQQHGSFVSQQTDQRGFPIHYTWLWSNTTTPPHRWIQCESNRPEMLPLQVFEQDCCTAVINHFLFAELAEHHVVWSLHKIRLHLR